MAEVLQKYKQTLYASLFACALISVSFYFASAKGSENAGAVVTATDQPRTVQKTKDTDGDGMRDWEEEVRGTNPLVPDKPEDYAASLYPSASTSAMSEEEIPDNATSRFSQNFLADYLTRSADGSLSEEEKAAFVQKSISEASVNAKDTLYSRGDIRISMADDPQSVSEYGNALGYILTKETVAADNELFILQRALQTESPETLEALDPLIAAYKNMLEGARAVSVPAPLANEHIALLNTLLALHNDIVAMRNVFEDGLPTAVRVQRYDSDVDAFYSVLVAITEGLITHGAVYTETDPGAFFAQFE